MLDAALHSIDDRQARRRAKVLASALERQRTTIRELRDLSFALEPVVLRDQGFGPALQALAEQVGTREPDPDRPGRRRRPSEIGETAQVALYTIIRELLDQAVRRGPPTPRRGARCRRPPTAAIETVVADDAEPERRRRSFEAIEERVKQLHGSIEVDADDAGTRVVVTLPPTRPGAKLRSR